MSESNKNSNTKTDKKPDELDARRKAVRAIVLGGGAVVGAKSVPSEWAAPIVNSVVLPVHAATTDDTDASSGGQTTAAPTSAPTSAPTAAPTSAPTEAPTTCPPGYYGYNCAYYNFQ